MQEHIVDCFISFLEAAFVSRQCWSKPVTVATSDPGRRLTIGIIEAAAEYICSESGRRKSAGVLSRQQSQCWSALMRAMSMRKQFATPF